MTMTMMMTTTTAAATAPPATAATLMAAPLSSPVNSDQRNKIHTKFEALQFVTNMALIDLMTAETTQVLEGYNVHLYRSTCRR
jgi:hypothetical protein